MLYSRRLLNKEIKNLKAERNLSDKFVKLGHEVEEVKRIDLSGLVVGRIRSYHSHPEKEKLNVCQVDIGDRTLEIVCGASNVTCNALVIVAIEGAKLGEKEIRATNFAGVESQGMLCALEELGLDQSCVNPENKPEIHIIEEYEANVGDDAVEIFGLNDVIYDISLTANRGDCLSYRGMSRDLGALFEDFYEEEQAKIAEQDFEKIAIDLSSSVAYIGISDFNNEESPTWLKVFLAKHKIAAKNFILDYLEYLRILTGCTFNAYDLDKLELKSIRHENLSSTKIVEIGGKETTLSAGTSVVLNEDQVISVLGLAQVDGYNLEKNSKNILIELGSLNQEQIRKINSKLKIKNDNQIRSEKGIDHISMRVMVRELSSALEQVDADFKVLTYHEQPKPEQVLTLNLEQIKRVLGIDLEFDEVVRSLNLLGFNVKHELLNKKKIEVKVPSWRFDIEHDNDLIEEIIRLIGVERLADLDDFETIIHPPRLSQNKMNLNKKLCEKSQAAGFDQVITYSLIDEKMLKEFNPQNHLPFSVLSPISQEHKYYRVSLLPSLLKSLRYNLDRRAKAISFFEQGRTYRIVDTQIREEENICFVQTGVKATKLNGVNEYYDFSDFKNKIMMVLSDFGQYIEIEPSNQTTIFNPYAQGIIKLAGIPIGIIGKLKPGISKKYNKEIFACEINLNKLYKLKLGVKQYQPLSTTAPITRQLTFNVSADKTYQEITTIFAELAYLTNYTLVSKYAGENIKEGYISYSFELTFDGEEQLTNEQVDQEIQTIITRAQNNGFIFNQG